MTSSIVVTPKRGFPCAETRRLSHKAWKSVQRFDLGAGWRKKRKDRTGQSKKSQRRYILPIWGEAPTEPIFTKLCTVVAVPDVITNFWAEIIRGYDFTGGRISSFPIDSFMGLTTVQRYCAACDRFRNSVCSPGRTVAFYRNKLQFVVESIGRERQPAS